MAVIVVDITNRRHEHEQGDRRRRGEGRYFERRRVALFEDRLGELILVGCYQVDILPSASALQQPFYGFLLVEAESF